MIVQNYNKLLKMLEDPPITTYFILITNSLHDVLPTIISRCQISTLRPINYNDHKNVLESSFKGIEHDLIVNSSKGSLARSMNYIYEDVASISHEQNFIECLMFAFLAKKSKKAVLDLTKWADRFLLIQENNKKSF